MKPSKCPFKIRSPIGDGALRGRASELSVADRRGLLVKGIFDAVGLTAVLGGGLGGNLGFAFCWGLTKAALLSESLRRRAVPRSKRGSGRGVASG